MPTFTYTGDPGRYYPTLGVAPDKGAAYELDSDPGDGRWQPADARSSKPSETTDPTEPVEPAQAGTKE